MILTDGIHVVSNTSLDDLHRWAACHGIPRRRFHKGRWPHYDLPRWRHGTTLGAKQTNSRGLIEAMRNGPILDELIGEDRAIGGATHPGSPEPTASRGDA